MRVLIPEWSIDKEIGRLLDFYHIAVNGIVSAEGQVDLIDAIRLAERGRKSNPPDEVWEEKIRAAENIERAAKRHMESGFAYLYELMAIKFWSILEAGIEEISVECLKRPDECKDAALLRSLKGPLIEFSSASSDQRAEFLLSELKASTRSALKIGANVFEVILEPLGMAGPVDDPANKIILELQQTRHILVHRRGVVDKRFLDACPFLSYQIGDRVVVTQESVRRFGIGVGLYNIELQRRNYVRAGVEVAAELFDDRDKLLSKL